MKDTKKGDFTTGPITKNILLFALPLMCGNLLQQMYNIADTWVVGRFLGADALAAVGSSYTLMVFLTSILLGLCMGSGAAISMDYGSGQTDRMRRDVFLSFALIAALSTFLNVLVYVFIDPILDLLCVPADVVPLMKTYLLIIFAGIFATFLYNYYASILRAIGNSVVPLIFLAVAALLLLRPSSHSSYPASASCSTRCCVSLHSDQKKTTADAAAKHWAGSSTCR